MPEGNDFVRDIRLPEDLPSRDRFKVMLMARGYTVAAWARSRGFHDSQVWMCISGERPYPQVREALAEELELDRATVDRMIDGMPDSNAENGPLGKAPGAEVGARAA